MTMTNYLYKLVYITPSDLQVADPAQFLGVAHRPSENHGNIVFLLKEEQLLKACQNVLIWQSPYVCLV